MLNGDERVHSAFSSIRNRKWVIADCSQDTRLIGYRSAPSLRSSSWVQLIQFQLLQHAECPLCARRFFFCRCLMALRRFRCRQRGPAAETGRSQHGRPKFVACVAAETQWCGLLAVEPRLWRDGSRQLAADSRGGRGCAGKARLCRASMFKGCVLGGSAYVPVCPIVGGTSK
jgi:hypothetical protein